MVMPDFRATNIGHGRVLVNIIYRPILVMVDFRSRILVMVDLRLTVLVEVDFRSTGIGLGRLWIGL